jgi:undecaprenyl diphosphate synthase
MDIRFTEQSTLHIDIIMDGNGRWALARGLPRVSGHRAGVETVSRVVEAAPAAGVGILTLFAFSSDNWRRPREEVEALMRLLADYLQKETARSVDQGIRIEIIGRRDRLDAQLRAHIEQAEAATASGTRLRLRIAVDYSGRDAILAAERRLSDFLLWECAYAEFIFSRRMWPDFGAEDLLGAVQEFRGRERRFGAVPPMAMRRREAWLDWYRDRLICSPTLRAGHARPLHRALVGARHASPLRRVLPRQGRNHAVTALDWENTGGVDDLHAVPQSRGGLHALEGRIRFSPGSPSGGRPATGSNLARR